MEKKEGVFQDRRQQFIQTTQNMYLGGVPQDYTVMTEDFDSVILNSLKGGCIRHLTFNEKLFNFMDYLKRDSVIFDGDDYSEPTPKDLIVEKPVTNAPTTTATSTTSYSVGPSVSRSTAEVPGTGQLPTSFPSTTEVSDTPEPPTMTEPVITTTEGVQTTPTTAASRCLMPQKPDQLTGVMGFGLDLNSHADYNIAGPLLKLKGRTTDLSFQFRASNPNGILLYTANANQADFLECHVEYGKVSCSFSAGGGILKLTSDEASYSDGNWHTVKLSRDTTTGTLYIDRREKDSGKASGSSTSIDGLTKLFLGGVPDGFDNRRVPAGSRVSLPGCIRNVTVDRKDIGPPTTSHKVQECYQGTPESGVSFEHGGGSLKVGEQYRVGLRQEIFLEIKPTSDTGLLLSSSSSKDYIVLEMDRGNVIFRAENGGGQVVVEYSSEDPLALCDGNWHKIKALKDGNLVRLKVDDGPEREGGGKGSQIEANIYDPLYAGGLPEGLVGKGVTVNESYTGCMRNLVSWSPRGIPQRLSLTNPVMMTGNVFLGGCPYT